jgi:glycosyltransferase involved in cell wall biosynthesis
MTRRLLAISWEMPPLSGPRAVQVGRMLKFLVPLGWDSTVVCFAPRARRYGQDDELAESLRTPGVTLVPVRSPEDTLFVRAVWRIVPPLKLLPDEHSVWIRPASRTALRLARTARFDVLVSFGQPWSDHLIGRRVHRATGLPWIAHFSDPWIDSPYLIGQSWQRRLWARMEAEVVRHANALVFTNTQTAAWVMRKYPREWQRKVHVVPHGFDPDVVEKLAGARNQRGAAAQGPLTIAHTGRFYEGMRTPEPLLRALAALTRRRPIAKELRVAFVGPADRSHRRLAIELGLDEMVEFTGRLPFAESLRRAADADVLMVIDAPSDDSLFLPSKLIDYLPLDKPILALTPPHGASADVVRALGYPVVPPADEAAIASAIENLLDAKRQRRLAVAPPHRIAAQSYDIRRTAHLFSGILERCA